MSAMKRKRDGVGVPAGRHGGRRYPSPPADWRSNAGLTALVMGALILLFRFGVLPISSNTSVTGVGAGFAMAGLGLCWLGAQTRRSRIAFAVIGPSLAIVCATLAYTCGQSYGQTLLRERSIAGFSLSLPEWPVQKESSAFGSGTLVLESPRDSGGLVELKWAYADPVASDGVSAAFGMAGQGFQPAEQGRVDEHPATTSYQDAASRRAFLTCWYCPRDGRAAYLLTSLKSTKEDLLELHHRILASVKCHTIPEDSRPERAFPKLATPTGYTKISSRNALMFESPACTIGFTPGVPGKKYYSDALAHPEFGATFIGAIVHLTNSKTDPVPKSVPGRDGHVRSLWVATGENAEHKNIRVQFMLWYCDKSDTTFTAFAIENAANDAEKTLSLLLEAECH
ncbi:MAG TPA: hypothetical protein VGP72_28545 [Planctomycetota bacterium]